MASSAFFTRSAACNFGLLRVKTVMKSKHFELAQDVEAATTVQLNTFPKEDSLELPQRVATWVCGKVSGAVRRVNSSVSSVLRLI